MDYCQWRRDDAIPVKGINTLYTNSAGQISAVYAGFNSGAWLHDLDSPECSPTAAMTLSTATSTTAFTTGGSTSSATTTAV